MFFSVLTVAMATGGEASAFCRTTTCKCRSDERLPDGPSGLPRSTCGLPDGDCPRDEHGCRTTGTPVAWSGSCVGYSPNLTGTSQLTPDEWDAAFQAAFDAWQLVDCGGGEHPSIQAFALRPTTCAANEYNASGPNVHSIYFSDRGWSGPQTKHNLDDVLARAKVTFTPDGEIVDADIAINSARHDFTVIDDPRPGDQDLVSVLTHEVGHFLGLDHTDEPSAVMYWRYSAGTKNRALHQDDIDAICTVYPPARKASCEPAPRGGLRDTCGPDPELRAGCAVGQNGGAADGVLGVALGALTLAIARKRIERGRGR